MKILFQFYLTVAVLCIVQQQVAAIQCYVCSSFNDDKCASKNVPDDLMVNCSTLLSHKFTMCRKTTQEMEFQIGQNPPDVRVIRECGWDHSQYLEKCYSYSGFGTKQKICTCTTDFCNSASKSMSMIGILFLASFMTYVIGQN